MLLLTVVRKGHRVRLSRTARFMRGRVSIYRCSGPLSVAVTAQCLYQGPLEQFARKHAVCCTAHSDGRRSLLICRFYLRPAAAQDENQILAGGGPDLHLWRVDRCHSI